MAIDIWDGSGLATTDVNWVDDTAPGVPDTAKFDGTSVLLCTFDIPQVAAIELDEGLIQLLGALILGTLDVGGSDPALSALFTQKSGSSLQVTGAVLVHQDDTSDVIKYVRESGTLDSAFGSLAVEADGELDCSGDSSTISVAGTIDIDRDSASNFGITKVIQTATGNLANHGPSNAFNDLQIAPSGGVSTMVEEVRTTGIVTYGGGTFDGGNFIFHVQLEGERQFAGASNTTFITDPSQFYFRSTSSIKTFIEGGNYATFNCVIQPGAKLALDGDADFATIRVGGVTDGGLSEMFLEGHTVTHVTCIVGNTNRAGKLYLQGGTVKTRLNSFTVINTLAATEIIGPGFIDGDNDAGFQFSIDGTGTYIHNVGVDVIGLLNCNVKSGATLQLNGGNMTEIKNFILDANSAITAGAGSSIIVVTVDFTQAAGSSAVFGFGSLTVEGNFTPLGSVSFGDTNQFFSGASYDVSGAESINSNNTILTILGSRTQTINFGNKPLPKRIIIAKSGGSVSFVGGVNASTTILEMDPSNGSFGITFDPAQSYSFQEQNFLLHASNVITQTSTTPGTQYNISVVNRGVVNQSANITDARYNNQILRFDTDTSTDGGNNFLDAAEGASFAASFSEDNHITVARDRILARWREDSVASVAGISSSTWNNSDGSIGHVFSLDSPGSINRGRTPHVRCVFNNDSNDFINDQGGMTIMSFDVEVVVGGVTGKTNSELADAIMSAGEFAMRNNNDSYWKIMDSSSAVYLKQPMLTTLTRTFTAELTWSVDSV